MKIIILPTALDDLMDGFHFYEEQSEGLGDYFHNCLFSDIDSLRLYAGIHLKKFGPFKTISVRSLLRSGTRSCSRMGCVGQPTRSRRNQATLIPVAPVNIPSLRGLPNAG